MRKQWAIILLAAWLGNVFAVDVYPAPPTGLSVSFTEDGNMAAFVLEITTVGSDETVVIPTSGGGC